jgi:TolB-like protein/tetratricopeptide (TPR) repeat protein
VDFEAGLNTAVRKLRNALDDSADHPRFVETLPRRGYRFMHPVERVAEEISRPATWWRLRWVSAALGAIIVAIGLLAANVGGLRDGLLGPAPGEIKAIAVLPLKNLSGDPGQDYFAEAMTELLITELGRVPSLTVPSHQTMRQFSDTKKPLPEIARDLKVDALIEGTVLAAGNRTRITINLLQVEPERHLLSEKYDRDVSDILTVQDQVTRDVARRIGAGLNPGQQHHLASSRPPAPEVNDAYLKALHHFSRGTDRDRARAFEYFQEAVQKDPNFAAAYAGMALLDAHGGGYRAAGAGPEFRAQARQWALKALELDETLAEAHTALAWLELNDWDFAGADREFTRAIELNPNLVVARIWYISYLTAMRGIEEADMQGEVALRLSPAAADVVSHVATHHLSSGRVDKAIELYRKALDLEPNYFFAHLALGKCYLAKGMYEWAVAEIEKATDLTGRNIGNLSVLAPAYILAGRRADGLKIVRELEQRGGGRGLAFAYIALGEKEEALTNLKARVAERTPYMAFLLADPLFEPLRADPRFHELVRRVGFPPDTLRRAGIPTEASPAAPAAPVRTPRQQPPK